MATSKTTRLLTYSAVLPLGMLIFAATWAMQSQLNGPATHVPLFWPTSGLMVAILLIVQRRHAPLLVICASIATALAIMAAGEHRPAIAIAYALIDAVGYSLLAFLTRHWCNGRRFLARGRSTCGFIAGSAVASALAATLFMLLQQISAADPVSLQIWLQ